MSDDATHVLTNPVIVQCPFCEGAYVAGQIGLSPCLMHTIPTCSMFDDNHNPAEFMRIARERIELLARRGQALEPGAEFKKLVGHYDKLKN